MLERGEKSSGKDGSAYIEMFESIRWTSSSVRKAFNVSRTRCKVPQRRQERGSTAFRDVRRIGRGGTRAFSRSSGVSTLSGTSSTRAIRDRHAGLEGAQLLELLALLERRRFHLDEPAQGGALERIDADMVVESALAVRRARAGEIERAARSPPTSQATTGLTTLGLSCSASSSILAARVAISAPVAGQRVDDGADGVRIERRQVRPCRLTTTSCSSSDRPPGGLQKSGPSPRAGRGAVRTRAAAAASTRPDDFVLGGGPPRRARPRPRPPAPDAHDHGQSRDIGQRLARKPRGGHAGGDQDDGLHGDLPGFLGFMRRFAAMTQLGGLVMSPRSARTACPFFKRASTAELTLWIPSSGTRSQAPSWQP